MTTRKLAAVVCGCLCGFLSFVVTGRCLAQGEGRPAPVAVEAADGMPADPDFPKTYGPLDASRDAYQRAEKQRRAAIDRQLQSMEDTVWYSGVPGDNGYRPSLESIYAYGGYVYGPPRVFRRSERGAYRSPYRYPYRYPYYPGPYVFEPWPLVPGDIYGYPYVDRVEQPLGHKVIRTGPNSYIYRPVYASDLKPLESPIPAPPQAQPREPVPDAGVPEVRQPALVPPAVPEPIPAPPPEGGPREF